MTETYLGEIRQFAFGFCPKGWAYCDGSLLSINEYGALYSLLGVNFGGDGRETFALPDLRSRTPMSAGDTSGYHFFPGLKVGEETVALAVDNMPAHSHGMKVENNYGTALFAGSILAIPNGDGEHLNIYNENLSSSSVSLNEGTVGMSGEGAPHNNMQPFLSVNYCIAVTGEYPPRP